MLEFIVPFTDKAAAEKFDRYHGTNGELVRCKDCKHFEAASENEGNCSINASDDHEFWISNDWFCADGGITMRLIDADALKEEVEFQQEHMWPEDLSYCIPRMIDNAPTIDAIPVEWLDDRANDITRAPLFRRYAQQLLDEWQKEQEAIEENSNEGKTGTWEPLGHIIGYMNHPYSEYYKCSLCGHEQYTLFDLPPDTCPSCRAHLTMEQEVKYDE